MDFEQFLEEYETLDIKTLEREQQEAFRKIFVEHGMLDKALEISEVIYETNPNDEAAVVSLADNLMHLDRRDDALVLLYNAEKTAQTLLLEGIIYKYDMLLDVAEEKFKQASELVNDDEELREIINAELANVYVEVGRGDDALNITYDMFTRDNNYENFKNVLDNLVAMAKFEEAVEFYRHYGKDYDEADIHFAVAFAYNQLHELDKSKEELIRTIELDREHRDAYLHLGFMSRGEEAINYFENFLELQGYSQTVYLQLTALYRQEEQYDKIRELVRNVLSTMGIDLDTLYISINALRSLYEVEKIYDIYNEHDIIKEDSSLLALTLLALSEDEDYVDFAIQEVQKYHQFLLDEPFYPELLDNLYEATGDLIIDEYLDEANSRRAVSHSQYFEDLGYYEDSHHHEHGDDCDCGHHH